MLIIPSFKKEIGQRCPKCYSGNLRLRKSKFGYFLGCSKYPQCLYKVSEKMIDKHKDFNKIRRKLEKKLKRFE